MYIILSFLFLTSISFKPKKLNLQVSGWCLVVYFLGPHTNPFSRAHYLFEEINQNTIQYWISSWIYYSWHFGGEGAKIKITSAYIYKLKKITNKKTTEKLKYLHYTIVFNKIDYVFIVVFLKEIVINT